jgi:hypothetical protein
MARRVFFHVGTLKTGTTYLQRVMWENRDRLRAAGTLFAGDYYHDRVWATQTVRDMHQPHERAASAWDRMVEQINAFDGDAIVSHEFFGGADHQQAAEAMARVAPAEVHVVATARDLVGIFPAMWQEQVKFGHTVPFADYDPLPLDVPPRRHWSWRTIDVADVLRRWTVSVPAQRVHVVTMPPPGSPRDLLWERFAEACGFDPAVASLDLQPVNESMGVAEAELLRRVNLGLHEELKPVPEPARWVRGYLGLEVLAPRRGEKLRVSSERAKALLDRSREIADQLREAGYHVVGDLDDLLGPSDPPTSRQPEEVEDPELLEVALDVINTMLADHRRLGLENAELRNRLRRRRKLQPVRRTPASLLRGAARRARRRLGR